MKKLALALLALIAVLTLLGVLVFRDVLFGEPLASVPAAKSLRPELPAAEGWNGEKLEAARRFAEKHGISAVIVLHDGRVVAEWGATDRRIDAHSVRKSLVSALYGVAIDRGEIGLDASLASLGVDDDPPLTEAEREATLADLLTSRSGIYRDSVKNEVERDRPARGAHRPGEHFFYNNWGFNALGAILEQASGLELGTAFSRWLAEPLGMRDFRPEDVRYTRSAASRFPAYRIRISARDLARVGLLYARHGEWRGQRILSEGWVRESTRPQVAFENGYGYGYLWWTFEDGSYWAAGTGSQMLLVDPPSGTVIVSRVDTRDGLVRRVWNLFGKRSSESDFFRLVHEILAAAPA